MTNEEKRLELNKKFEIKKTNFLNTLFTQIDALRSDLNDLSEQFKELSVEDSKKNNKK